MMWRTCQASGAKFKAEFSEGGDECVIGLLAILRKEKKKKKEEQEEEA